MELAEKKPNRSKEDVEVTPSDRDTHGISDARFCLVCEARLRSWVPPVTKHQGPWRACGIK